MIKHNKKLFRKLARQNKIKISKLFKNNLFKETWVKTFKRQKNLWRKQKTKIVKSNTNKFKNKHYNKIKKRWNKKIKNNRNNFLEIRLIQKSLKSNKNKSNKNSKKKNKCNKNKKRNLVNNQSRMINRWILKKIVKEVKKNNKNFKK